MLSTMMTAGNAVVQIMKMDVVAAIVQLPEVHLARVHARHARRRARRRHRAQRTRAQVAILNDRVDPVSRAFEVRLAIENADYALKPGLFAELGAAPRRRASATLLERGALLGGEGARYVFVLAGGRAARRPCA